MILTEDKIIVGHNVAFDYNFLRNEYKRLGYDYKRKTLCTVKLSRKLILCESHTGLEVYAKV